MNEKLESVIIEMSSDIVDRNAHLYRDGEDNVVWTYLVRLIVRLVLTFYVETVAQTEEVTATHLYRLLTLIPDAKFDEYAITAIFKQLFEKVRLDLRDSDSIRTIITSGKYPESLALLERWVSISHSLKYFTQLVNTAFQCVGDYITKQNQMRTTCVYVLQGNTMNWQTLSIL